MNVNLISGTADPGDRCDGYVSRRRVGVFSMVVEVQISTRRADGVRGTGLRSRNKPCTHQ